jgi:AraC family transcriptional regulator
MEWITKMNQAINYIEDHLTEEIDLEQLAKIACCSAYHFQRMFSYMASAPLSEYIRRRKMSLAAIELASTDAKIIDVAHKYGYASPTAFNRAFQTVHGIAPSFAKEVGVTIKSYPKISFKIIIKGAEEMNFRIEQKEAFRIVGVSQPLYKEMEKNFEVVPKMWGQVSVDGTLPKLAGLMNGQPMGMLGVSVCNEKEEWRYYIAVSSTAAVEAPLEEYMIPAATWAVFPGEGTALSIQELEQRIFTEWLPESGYEYGDAPDIEVYLSPDPNDAKYEVWLPVIKK